LERRRLLNAGDTDSSFGGGSGFATPDLTEAPNPAQAIAVQPDGKILLVGR